MSAGLKWIDGDIEIKCVVCDEVMPGRRVVEYWLDDEQTWEAARCSGCQTLSVSGEFFDEREISDEDIDYYVELTAGPELHAALLPQDTQIRSMLDVGCNFGFALAYARDALGWEVVGLEPSPAGTRGREELDLDIRVEFLTEERLRPEGFDLVCASELIEHVPDPRELLRSMRAQLRPGGQLVMTTPAAETVGPTMSLEDAVMALSPGLHMNLFTQDSLERLTREAGFGSVAVTRRAQTLYAVAVQEPGVELSPIRPGSAPREQLEAFYRATMHRAGTGSALDAGMTDRLLRQLINQGRFVEARELVPHAHELAAARWGIDLNDPQEVMHRVRQGEEFSASLIGIAHSLGFVALLGDRDPDSAAQYFELTDEIGRYLEAEQPRVYAVAHDVHESAVRHRVLAAAQAPDTLPASRLPDALQRLDEMTAAGAISQPQAARVKARAFVEAVTRGRDHASLLVDMARSVSPALARESDVQDRALGLDGLYCLATFSAGRGQWAESVSWTNTARDVIAGCHAEGPEDAEHMQRLDRSLLEHLHVADEMLENSVHGDAADPGTPDRWAKAAHGLDSYWVDEAGIYLSGWIHAGGERVRRIEVCRGQQVTGQEPVERADLLDHWPEYPDVVWAGFELYLSGSPTAAVQLRAITDTREIAVQLDLPPHPLPEIHDPRIDGPITIEHAGSLLAGAPPGPVLAIGLRSVDGSQRATMQEAVEGRELVVVDIHPGADVDVVADVHQLQEHFPQGHFAAVLSASVLEHLRAPWLAAAQIRRVTMPGGLVVHSAPFAWPEHSQPNDFWRFTPMGLAELFGPRTGFEVVDSGRTGQLRLLPDPQWREAHASMPTFVTAGGSWIVSRAVPDWDPDAIRWPYEDTDVVTAEEYPVEGLAPVVAAAEESQTGADGLSVSAVLPLYNGRRYLMQTLQSVADQTRPPDELVVVDDGSTDGAADLIAEFDFGFPVTLIKQDNRGQSAARNAGIAQANGDIIALLDQDDQWRPHHIEALLAPFADDPELAWSYSDFEEIDAADRTMVSRYIAVHGVQHPKQALVDCLASDLMVLPSASLIRKEVIEEVGGFDPQLSGYEDDDLFVRIFARGWGHRFLPESTVRYRVHRDGATISQRYLKSRIRYLRKMLDMFPPDRDFNRDFGQDALLPRLRAATLNDYTQALALRQYDRARMVYSALQEIDAMQRDPGPRQKVGTVMMRNPKFMRSALLAMEKLPAPLRPVRRGQLSLSNRTAVREERRRSDVSGPNHGQ